ncbi:hypothetical protein [Frankia sp. AgB1.8]|uniref:hypothetical protein n=1 Tax=Frankia sp. AgB1.8 TaxID=2792839 RepID=UPI0019318D83|nr:hypothetical protein [Frankia sp. AgB1.8]
MTSMWSWQIMEAAGREHTEDLRRASTAARAAREARAADDAPPRRPLALDPDDVYPDEPAPDRAGRGRPASRRRG